MQIHVHGMKKTTKWCIHVPVEKKNLVSSIHVLVKLIKMTTKWRIHSQVA